MASNGGSAASSTAYRRARGRPAIGHARASPAHTGSVRQDAAPEGRFSVTGYSTIPYTIAFANELVNDPIRFVPYAGRLRLAYLPSRPATG